MPLARCLLPIFTRKLILHDYLEILEECYREALEAVKEDYPDSNFPDICPFAEDIDGLLNHKFWEDEK